MSARLQVLLPENEMEDIRKAAALAIIRRAARLSYPTAGIHQMLSEIDQRYPTANVCDDVDVLPQILHRCSAIGRRDSIDETFQLTLGLVNEVFAFDRADVVRAQIALKPAMFSARDSLPLAVMDRWPGLTRIHRV